MKRLLSTVIVAIAAMNLWAADVSTSQAQAAANAFLRKQVTEGHLKASAATNLKLVKAEKSVAKPSAVDYYIFNSAKSYVVVAGDDLAPQILMYGEEGALDINNIPPGMQWLLNKYKYQIDGLKAGTMVPVKIPKYATTPVAPLVTANWDQSAPYNNQCPTSGSSRAVTGCPATSLSMCYYKWKWPNTYPACAAINGSTTQGYSAAALPTRDADWDNIIDEYTGPSNYNSTPEQKEAVAWLMRYAGQSIPDYYYTSSASGANDPEIYQGVLNMGYTDAQYLLLTELVSSGWSYTNSEQYYTDAEWNEYMMNELHNGRPIEYLAYDVSYGYSVSGHAFNVFGCDANGKYFVNWGWSGDSNGYCTLHNFTTSTGATGQSGSYTFNYGEAMIIGIEPPAGALTDPRITATPTTITMNTIVGNPVTETITVKGYNLTADVNLTLGGDNAFSLSTTGISAAQAQAQGGVTVTVTYNPAAAGTNEATVTLSSTDAPDVTVKLNGTADLETYAPVMLEASNITSTSFTATWTDETPAENVESYTLYVSAEPFLPAVALLDSIDWTSNNNVPNGWTQSGLSYWPSNSASYLSSDGFVQSRTYDLTGYDKVTVMVYSEPYNNNNTLSAATSVDSKTISLPSGASFAWYTFVLDCASSDYVKLTSTGLPDMRYMKVYAGDLTSAMMLKASETGDATYRVITGITGKSYTVNGLTENGSFYYYVVANYIDGGTGDSNVEEVTLFDNGHSFVAGDVNHDTYITIDDVTALINYLLTDDASSICLVCADVNGDTFVTIDDVTALINILLTSN
ncbi:MAG: C10 family peptidase [Muribaculaceae bacterium]|nr:C10 family peptidase [Muribaculaceae bacterium]